ncbi:MAG: SHOCT domain-containing protein [Bacteroidales bacterium]|nr:SHOCT domain-containing protein [Bacteroidales bacterium]
MMEGFGMHGWGMGWGWIIGLIVLGLIIWLIVWSVNQNKGGSQSSEKSPLDILKERYARGEIDKEEFDQRKKDLMWDFG